MILIQIAIISFLVFAIHYVFQHGEIFGFVSDWWGDQENKLLQRADDADNVAKSYEMQSTFRADAVDKRRKADRAMSMVRFVEKLKEPLFACPVCMAPWHGTYLYWLIQWPHLGLPTHHLCAWLVIIISCLGLNSIIVRIFNTDD